MKVYAYADTLICESCAKNIINALVAEGIKDTGDSGDYPQGPLLNGGGAADYPQYCDICDKFLYNPITKDGGKYVIQLMDKIRGTIQADELISAYFYLFQEEEEK